MADERHLKSGFRQLLLDWPFPAEQGFKQLAEEGEEKKGEIGWHCEVRAVVDCWFVLCSKPGLCAPYHRCI